MTSSERIRAMLGVLTVGLFVVIGFNLIASERTQLGALLLALAALRGGLLVRQVMGSWNKEEV